MPADTVTETVAVDRERLVALLIEALAAVDLIEGLVPGRLDDFTRELNRTVNEVAGYTSDIDLDEVWRDGENRGSSVLAAVVADLQARIAAAPLSIQLLAVGVAERELAARRVAAELEEVGVDG